jgi:hypothetical protein
MKSNNESENEEHQDVAFLEDSLRASAEIVA